MKQQKPNVRTMKSMHTSLVSMQGKQKPSKTKENKQKEQ
jgi:hypothetical protein